KRWPVGAVLRDSSLGRYGALDPAADPPHRADWRPHHHPVREGQDQRGPAREGVRPRAARGRDRAEMSKRASTLLALVILAFAGGLGTAQEPPPADPSDLVNTLL